MNVELCDYLVIICRENVQY